MRASRSRRLPLLARIIDRRGLADSAFGTRSLTAGSFDNACSWCVLATFAGGVGIAILAIGGDLLMTVLSAARRLL